MLRKIFLNPKVNVFGLGLTEKSDNGKLHISLSWNLAYIKLDMRKATVLGFNAKKIIFVNTTMNVFGITIKLHT